jgi:hypothetical protein
MSSRAARVSHRRLGQIARTAGLSDEKLLLTPLTAQIVELTYVLAPEYFAPRFNQAGDRVGPGRTW